MAGHWPSCTLYAAFPSAHPEPMAEKLPDILRQIVEQRRKRLAAEIVQASRAEEVGRSSGELRFFEHLRTAEPWAIIAEVKMGSPRLGSLHGRVNPIRQAQAYADCGATALSVVVEPDFFYGSYDLLARCRESCGLPTLAKDFVVEPIQLEWARSAGADAVLLIAAINSAQELVALAARARELGMIPLVECHSDADLDKLDGETWDLVGINNRDLRTFEVDLERSIRLLGRVPEGALRVAESGIRSRRDIERLARAGFEAFLIGESLLLAPDPRVLIRDLLGR